MMKYNKGGVLVVVLIVIVIAAAAGAFAWFKYGKSFSVVVKPPEVNVNASASPVVSLAPSASPTASSYIWGVFTGTLPCADCSGLKTTLTLLSSGPSIDTGNFTLSQVYEGKSVQPLVTAGSWTVDRGMPGNANATVVVLTPADGSQVQYLLRVGENTLTMLDVNQKVIATKLNMSLMRQTAPEVPSALETTTKLNTVKAQLIGTWQDQTDPHYQTEFKTDGTQIDSYNGEEQTSTTGTWTLFNSSSNEPTSFQLNTTDVYIKQVMGTATVYFRIASVDAVQLQLVNMDKGGVLQFKKLK